MNIQKLSLLSLRHRSFHTMLCVLMTAFSVMSGVLVILTADHVRDRIARDTAGIDLVIGARGSPLQLILSSLYQIDIPTGNIAGDNIEIFARNRDIAQVIPLALGDNLGGFRIVGTTVDYVALYHAEYKNGRSWEKPMEAVAGAYAAHKLNLDVGSQFSGAHGLAENDDHHHNEKYTVTGILQPTGTIIDRLVLTSVESVQELHHHEEAGHEDSQEITALLVKVKNPRAVINLPRIINRDTSVMTASPALELARLSAMMGLSGRLVMGGALVLLLMAALSIFSGLASNFESRAHDLVVMRLLGMPRKRLSAMIMMEASLISLMGISIGVVCGHLLFAGLIFLVEPLQASGANALTFRFGELVLFAIVMIAGLMAATVPALRAYRADVSSLLRSGS